MSAARSRIDSRVASALVAVLLAVPVPAYAQASPSLALELTGRAETLIDTARKPCGDVFTQPDLNARAFRDDAGQTRMFALDQENRSLVGSSLSTLTPTCQSSLSSGENPDPGSFDGRRYIAATWTANGRDIAALVHDEFHADSHTGACATKDALACWYNTVTAVRSDDGGVRFAPASPLVVAAAPFRSETDQTRHRGFFNPSNMVAGAGEVYVFTSTTGWPGQDAGACLLRNPDPLNTARWRGWNGRAFATRWQNPYEAATRRAESCAVVKPFGYPVASVVRHRPTGTFLALWEQPKLGVTSFGDFPVAGLYVATSRNLTEWSSPALFLASAIVHQPCGLNEENKGGSILAYPSLLDEGADGRNYDNIGDTAFLFVVRIGLNGCDPSGQRVLVRQPVRVTRPAR